MKEKECFTLHLQDSTALSLLQHSCPGSEGLLWMKRELGIDFGAVEPSIVPG